MSVHLFVIHVGKGLLDSMTTSATRTCTAGRKDLCVEGILPRNRELTGAVVNNSLGLKA